ncbi:hypothetical protein [Halorubrum halophilum]|uniref:DUF5789 family protein n=1 Tax=Halorubrum halophilum TaxID=413816 RepID=UPI00186AC052|nr:hypothetical protein [Halorubrum halophilum]
MRLPETRDLFAREFEFPVSREIVIERVGETELEAPTGQNETIGEVLARCETEEFNSPDSLYGSLMTFVSDGFIGRKYYDDRGGFTDPEDMEEVQF